MNHYHEPASAGNNTGLPKFRPQPLGLTVGGQAIYRRTCRPVATCNAMAELAGIGCEVAK